MMQSTYSEPAVGLVEPQVSGVSWGAVLAGAVASCAITLFLLALGTGLGLSAVSPWGNSGVSTTTFKIGTGLYFIVMAMMSSAIGGYLAGRLRTKWVGVHTDEVFFRDTAHGFLAWAAASVIGAVLLASPATLLATGATSGATQAAAGATQSSGPMEGYVDTVALRYRAALDQPAGLARRTGSPVHHQLQKRQRPCARGSHLCGQGSVRTYRTAAAGS